MGVKLLPRERLVTTGPVDHADWNYRPLIGFISRQRFKLALRHLDGRGGSALQIGYGSGIFMPELTRHFDRVVGIDIHQHAREVAAALAAEGVIAELVTGTVERLPFDDGEFDAVVAISSLEFVDAIEDASREMRRVLRPNGRAVVVTPGNSWLLDRGLERLSGKRAASDDFGGRRERVIPALEGQFGVVEKKTFPPLAPEAIRMYTALALEKR